MRKQQQLLQRQVQIMSTRNPVQRQQQLVQLMRDAQQMPQNLWTIKEVKQDVKAVPADDMKVRLLRPPEAYDDKGNPKKYTDKELKELKGPDKLPGYTGTLEDVKTNQLVLVYPGPQAGQGGREAQGRRQAAGQGQGQGDAARHPHDRGARRQEVVASG